MIAPVFMSGAAAAAIAAAPYAVADSYGVLAESSTTISANGPGDCIPNVNCNPPGPDGGGCVQGVGCGGGGPVGGAGCVEGVGCGGGSPAGGSGCVPGVGCGGYQP